MAGNALGPNPLLLLGLIERIHHPLIGIGPALFGHAMDQHAVDVIRVEHLPMVVDDFEHVLRLGPNLGLDKELFPGEAFDGLAYPAKGLVVLGAVEISDALVVGVTDELIELLLPQVELDVAAVAAGAEPESA